jgi:hypothetical protein
MRTQDDVLGHCCSQCGLQIGRAGWWKGRPPDPHLVARFRVSMHMGVKKPCSNQRDTDTRPLPESCSAGSDHAAAPRAATGGLKLWGPHAAASSAGSSPSLCGHLLVTLPSGQWCIQLSSPGGPEAGPATSCSGGTDKVCRRPSRGTMCCSLSARGPRAPGPGAVQGHGPGLSTCTQPWSTQPTEQGCDQPQASWCSYLTVPDVSATSPGDGSPADVTGDITVGQLCSHLSSSLHCRQPLVVKPCRTPRETTMYPHSPEAPGP